MNIEEFRPETVYYMDWPAGVEALGGNRRIQVTGGPKGHMPGQTTGAARARLNLKEKSKWSKCQVEEMTLDGSGAHQGRGEPLVQGFWTK